MMILPSAAATYETTLSKIKLEDFDLIEKYGYETSRWNELIHSAINYTPDT